MNGQQQSSVIARLVIGELRLLARSRSAMIAASALVVFCSLTAWFQRGMLERRRLAETSLQVRLDGERRAVEERVQEANRRYREGRRGDDAGGGRWLRQARYVESHLEPFAILPLSPWSGLSLGTQSVQLQGQEVKTGKTVPSLDSAEGLLFGHSDPHLLIALLTPILAVIVCSGWLAEERVSGRLPLLIVASGPRNLLAGKSLGRVAWICIAVLLACLAATLLGTDLNGRAMVRSILWTGVALVYGIVCALAVLLATVRASTESAALIRGVLLFLIAGIALPGTVDAFSRSFVPIPNRALVERDVREQRSEAIEDFLNPQRKAELLDRLEKQLIAEFPHLVDHTGKSKLPIRRLAWERCWNSIAERGQAGVDAASWNQHRLQHLLSTTSPVSAFEKLGTSLFVSDSWRQELFLRQVAAERRVFVSAFWSKSVAQKGDPGDYVQNDALAAEDVAELPRFRFEEPPLSDCLNQAAIPAAGLLLWISGLAYAAAWRLRHCQEETLGAA